MNKLVLSQGNYLKLASRLQIRKIGFYFLISLVLFYVPVSIADSNEQAIQKVFDQCWTFLSQMHKNIDGLDKAIAMLQQVAEKYPTNKDVYWKLSEVTFKRAEESIYNTKVEMNQKALAYAEKAAELNPNSPEAHYWIGTCAARIAELSGVFKALKLVKLAKKELEKCIELDSKHRFSILARAILAAIYTEAPWPLRDLEKAESYALEAVKMDPNLTLASVNLAKLYIVQKKFPLANAEIERCLAIKNPTYIWDSELYDWPKANILKKETFGKG